MSQKDYDMSPRWYVVHTYSGYENKVKTDLEKTVKNRELEEYFFACPPEIPIDDFKATLKFLKFLKTLTDEDVWETSGEEQVDASIYTIE